MDEPNSLIRECCFKDRDCTIRIHFHNAYELLFVRRGNISIRIDAQSYEAHAGSLLVIGRFEEHALEIRSPEYERSYMILDPVRLERMLIDRRLLFPLRNRPEGFCHLFDVSAHFDAVCAIYDALTAEQQSPGTFSELYCASRIMELLIYLQRVSGEKQGRASKPARSAILAVQTYIEEHFTEKLSISDLAARVFMTPCYLTHCFKETTGYSPKQYLVLHRIACAKELLNETALPIGEVAFRSGFTDINNFIRSFKRDTDLTPLRYRELNQERTQF